ncbi:retinol dehydrogenase 14-like [Achroia grisella]|uniref:retinol dehydrogenase 14-like n=1 Tax=Achroia grisella TaxID=688607 RepID=UPI0027D2E75A|nr:retinol dehydrogenase 14-like [Achroia grisella]
MCTSNAVMTGKVVIVTGANTGIGFEIAKSLAKRGAKVILACRNEETACIARDKIIAQTNNSAVIFKPLDLASLKSVRAFCQDIIETEDKLDILVNNAGIASSSNTYTEDGIIELMQVNHFAPFLLTLLLMPLLKKQPSRILNTSSILHYLGAVDLVNLNKKSCNDVKCYMNSKLCNVLFTAELARRLRETEVVVNAIHPGIVNTGISNNLNVLYATFFKIWCWFCQRSVLEAAQTFIHLSVTDEGASVSGKYFVDCSERFMSWNVNEKVGRELFDLSIKMVKYDGVGLSGLCSDKFAI